jgi:hypothetical protein
MILHQQIESNRKIVIQKLLWAVNRENASLLFAEQGVILILSFVSFGIGQFFKAFRCLPSLTCEVVIMFCDSTACGSSFIHIIISYSYFLSYLFAECRIKISPYFCIHSLNNVRYLKTIYIF